MLKGRSTGELLVIIIAGTVCIFLLVSLIIIGIIEIIDPDTDTSAAGSILADQMNTLIGLLAGFLAGSTNRRQKSDELAE